MNWILRNKEWLFSGAGVSIFLIAAAFLRRFLGPRNTTTGMVPIHGASLPQIQASAEVEARPPSFTKPTPLEIANQLAIMTPYQQRHGADTYKGLRVFWPAQFKNVHTQYGSDNKWLVFLGYAGEKHLPNDMIICTDVDLEKYPRLKSIHAGESLTVRGTITEVSTGDVTLKDSSFEFE